MSGDGMPYVLHHFVELGGQDPSGIRYLWNDTRASKDFAFPLQEAEALVARAQGISLRGRLALCVALFEAVAARFEPLHRDHYPSRFAEAAWCSLADKRYMHFDERRRSDWLGPVRGPLWCGFTWLGPALHLADDDASEWESALTYLVRLAYHVLPARETLDAWLRGSMDRLVRHHPAVPADPLDDLRGLERALCRADRLRAIAALSSCRQ